MNPAFAEVSPNPNPPVLSRSAASPPAEGRIRKEDLTPQPGGSGQSGEVALNLEYFQGHRTSLNHSLSRYRRKSSKIEDGGNKINSEASIHTLGRGVLVPGAPRSCGEDRRCLLDRLCN